MKALVSISLIVLSVHAAQAQQPGSAVPAPMAPVPAQPEPAPVSQPIYEPQPPMQAVAQEGASCAMGNFRPEGYSVGLGFGWAFPTELKAPNITSAKFHLSRRLIIEPSVIFTRQSQIQEVGTAEVKTLDTEMTLGANAHYTLRHHNKVSMNVVGGAAWSRKVTDPNGDDNNTVANEYRLNYGLSLDYWMRPHWAINFTALNPLFAYSKSEQEQGPNTVADTTNNKFGLVWSPAISAMVHLYF